MPYRKAKFRKYGIFCFLLLGLVLSGCKMELNSGLEEKEANEMLGQLLLHGVDASKEIDKDKTVSVWVEKGQFAQAEELLRNLGLPRRQRPTTDEIFKSSGLIPSPTEEWAKIDYAKKQELSRLIGSIPGVISAEVDIAIPHKTEPFQNVPPPSALVVVSVFKDSIGPDLIPKIKQLVAFSVQNISYDRVGVMIAPVDRPKRQPPETIEIWDVRFFKSSLQAALIVLAGTAALGAFLTAIVFYTVIIIRGKRGRG